jgi:hypothetical protein
LRDDVGERHQDDYEEDNRTPHFFLWRRLRLCGLVNDVGDLIDGYCLMVGELPAVGGYASTERKVEIGEVEDREYCYGVMQHSERFVFHFIVLS